MNSQEEKSPKAVRNGRNIDAVIAFLGVEVIGLTLFGFGGAFGLKLLQLFAVFLAFLAYPFLAKCIDKETMKSSLKWLIPLACFALLSSFSAFFFAYYGGTSGLFNFFFYSLLQFLGILGFFVLGACLRYIAPLKREYIIYGLLGTLALYVLIITIYSLARYGFFYAARFAGQVYYWDGVLFRVASEGKALVGFKLEEASLLYATAPAFILAASGCGLFALKPKEEKTKFIVVACAAALGLVSLAVIPDTASLKVLLAIYAFMGVIRLVDYLRKKNEKFQKNTDFALKIVFFVLIGIVGLGLLAFLIEPMTGLLAKIGIVKENGFFGTIVQQIEDAYYNGAANKPFFNISSILFGYHPNSLSVHLGRIYEFNLLWQNGLPCFLLLVYLCFYFIKKERDYLFSDVDTLGEKFVFISLILAIFLRFSLFDSEIPLVHSASPIFVPFASSSWHFVLMALLGLTFIPKKAKEEAHE